ncbi:hypothetical protein H0A64_07270 [Alcaligenaceae bacterium]|nr:hypothetical protein [Alcaligenaceae bacterium]
MVKHAWAAFSPWPLRIYPRNGRVNLNGGAIARIGVPLRCFGRSAATTAANHLHRAGRYLCTMCVGVGPGVAVILERVRVLPRIENGSESRRCLEAETVLAHPREP